MTGPHHAIIFSFTGMGHGAAAWIAQRREDMSYRARTCSGSFSMRTNMVGTSWLCVTLYSGTNLRKSSASKFSMITLVPPKRMIIMLERKGAAW